MKPEYKITIIATGLTMKNALENARRGADDTGPDSLGWGGGGSDGCGVSVLISRPPSGVIDEIRALLSKLERGLK